MVSKKNIPLNRLTVYLLSMIFFSTSCKKMVEIDAPVYSTNAGNVFIQDATAISALTGIYTNMSRAQTFTGSGSINMMAGLAADELTLYSGVSDAKFKAYFTNSLISDGLLNYGSESWGTLYQYIYYCNAAIEGLTASSSLSIQVKQQLIGEAKFLRAFFYFYLVNLYGDVPLAISTDYKINALLSRSSIVKVYEQIIADLSEAKNLLSTDYLNGSLASYGSPGSAERVRPTKWAASALLARVYLFKGDFSNAEVESSTVIGNSAFYTLLPTSSITSVFLKNSNEAIWQLQPVNSGVNTEEAKTFIITSTGPTTNTDRPVYISSQLLNSFEINDQRKTKWIDSIIVSGTKYFYPGKYKNNGASVTEYLMVLRLAEQFLIRAEARAQLGNISGAQSDLNQIRTRAGLPNTTASTQPSLLSAILQERRVELFTEWGSRWLDLKKSGNIDVVMSIVTPIKSSGTIQWQPYKQLYPLPLADIQKNPNLIQNNGYQ